jgi:leader peptidase (prepilin peptidase)/N-methyltransferase
VDALSDLATDPLLWLLPILLAPFVGSFLGVLVVRLPDGRPVALSRSACDRCGHRLGALDLIPLISFAVQRGRCRYCEQPIGPFPLAIELAATGVALWAVLATEGADVWLTCLLGWTLLTASWIDARTMILPDVLTLPLLIAGLFVTAINTPDSLIDHCLAAASGYLILFATAWTYRKLRGRDGLGLGDAKLLAALGAWLGLDALPVVLFMASCLGLAAAGAGALAGRRMTASTAIPFGPYLAGAGWLLWLYADSIADWASASPFRLFFGAV